MASLRADRVGRFGVPDHDVGVAARSDRALLRIDAEELGRIDAAQLDPAVEREASAAHAVRVEHHHAILDARHAVGNLRKVALAKLLAALAPVFAALEPEVAVVGRDDLQVIRCDRLPERLLVRHLTEGWRANPLRALEVRSRQVVLGEEEVLEARLAVDWAATPARQPD